MRLLPERADHDREGVARPQSPSDRCANSRRNGQNAVPLHDVLPHPGRHQARGKGGRMTTFTNIPKCIEDVLEKQNGATSRRDFLKTSGLLIVSLSAPAVAGSPAAAAQAAGPYPDPDFRQLDSWIVIHEDNTATFFVGKTDCGQGTGTSFRQMMSDELDIAYDKTTCIMGSTDTTVDQGGSGGSNAIQTSGWPMRRVAAEGRRGLLGWGKRRLAQARDNTSA